MARDISVTPTLESFLPPEHLKRYEDMVAESKRLEAEVSRLNSLKLDSDQLGQWEVRLRSREVAVADREKTIAELEKKAAVAEAKEAVRKEMFDTLFRNTTVRRNFTDQVTTNSYTPSGSSGGSETHTVSETRTEE